MKRFYRLATLLSVTAVALAGCSKELDGGINDAPEVRKFEVLANAYVSNDDTRTVIGEETNGKFAFNWGDQNDEKLFYAEVVDGASVAIPVPSESNLSECASIDNNDHATFKMLRSEGGTSYDYHAYYPYTAVSGFHHTNNEKIALITYPAVQEAVSNTVDPAGAVMYASHKDASIDDDLNFRFEHLAAYVKMTIKGLTLESGDLVKSVRFTALRDENGKQFPLSGTVLHSYIDNTIDTSSEDLTTSGSVTVNFSEALAKNITGDFDVWFTTIPTVSEKDPGYITHFSVRVETVNGHTYRREGSISADKADKAPYFAAGAVAKFSLTVNEELAQPSTSGNFVLVTDANQLNAGDKLIITNTASDSGKALSTTQNKNNRGATSITVSDSKISDISEAEILTLGGESGKWTLYANSTDAAGYLAATGGSGNNYLLTQTNIDDKARWTIDIASNNVATIKAIATGTTRNLLAYNKNASSGDIFSCYAALNSDVVVVYLFKEEAAAADGITVSQSNVKVNAKLSDEEGTGEITYGVTGDYSLEDVQIISYDGIVSDAEVDGEGTLTYMLSGNNYSTEQRTGEIVLSIDGENISTIITFVQEGAKEITVAPEEIVVYGEKETAITVSSTEYNIKAKAYSDDFKGEVVLVEDDDHVYTAGENISIDIMIDPEETDKDDVVGYVSIWREGDSERNAIKVTILRGDDDLLDAPEVREVSATTTSLSAKWTECEIAEGYAWVVVAKGGDPDSDSPVAEGTVDNNKADGGIISISNVAVELEAGTEYDFYVKSLRDGASSAWSEASEYSSFTAEELQSKQYVLLFKDSNSYLALQYKDNASISTSAFAYNGSGSVASADNKLIWTVTEEPGGTYTFENQGYYMGWDSESGNNVQMNTESYSLSIAKQSNGSIYISPAKDSSRILMKNDDYIRFYSNTSKFDKEFYLVPVGDSSTGGGTTEPEQPAESVICTVDGYTKGDNTNYNGSESKTFDNISWTIEGNVSMTPWRLGGGKSAALNNVDRAIYSTTAINENISKIELEHGSKTITVNSLTVIIAKDANFANVVSTLTPTYKDNDTIIVTRPSDVDWSNCYYKFVYNVTAKSGSNVYLEFKKAVLTGK